VSFDDIGGALPQSHGASDAARRYRVIARDHDNPDARLLAVPDRMWYVGAGWILQGDEADERQILIGSDVGVHPGLHGAGKHAQPVMAEMPDSAKPFRPPARATGLRLVGPNCLGVLSSRVKLNASFAARMPPAGELALVSQSGAITAGLIEWSAAHDVGFSAVVSLGDKIDVDFGDLLDFFALDGRTRAILLYIESTRLLAAYFIPIASAQLARNADEATAAARPFLAEGTGVVAKILSPDIVHKSEVGGVRLNLTSERAVRDAVTDIIARARAVRPDARITGVTIHPMVLRLKAREQTPHIAPS
jgi:acyl-CoA synthetase (NDP forming)